LGFAGEDPRVLDAGLPGLLRALLKTVEQSQSVKKFLIQKIIQTCSDNSDSIKRLEKSREYDEQGDRMRLATISSTNVE